MFTYGGWAINKIDARHVTAEGSVREGPGVRAGEVLDLQDVDPGRLSLLRLVIIGPLLTNHHHAIGTFKKGGLQPFETANRQARVDLSKQQSRIAEAPSGSTLFQEELILERVEKAKGP